MGFGEGFAQSFGLMAHILSQKDLMAQRAEELKMKGKELDLRSKLLEHQLEAFQQDSESGKLMRDEFKAAAPQQIQTQSYFPQPGANQPGEDPEAAAFAERTPAPMTATTPGRPVNENALMQAFVMSPQGRQAVMAHMLGKAQGPMAVGGSIAIPDGQGGFKFVTPPNPMQDRAVAMMDQALGGGLPGMAPGGAGAPQGAPDTLGGGMPVPAPQPAPTGVPGPQGAAPGAIGFQGFKVTPQGVTLDFGQTKLEVKDSTVEAAPGAGVFVHRRDLINPVTGQTVNTQMLGRAMPAEAVQRAETAVRSLGLDPGTELGKTAMGNYFIAQTYSGEKQNVAMDRWQKDPITMGMGRPGTAIAPSAGGPGPIAQAQAEILKKFQEIQQGAKGESVIQEANRIEAEQAATKAGKVTAAEEAARPLNEANQDAIKGLSAAQTAITEVKKFTAPEIDKFIKVMQLQAIPGATAAQALANMAGMNLGKDPKFLEFKAATGRLQATLFDIAGKQVTGVEKQVVNHFTPTGLEAGGAREYLSKLGQLEKFTNLALNVRNEVSRTGKGELNMAELQSRLDAAARKSGLGIPAAKPLEILKITPVR